jgi:hypothetical protein
VAPALRQELFSVHLLIIFSVRTASFLLERIFKAKLLYQIVGVCPECPHFLRFVSGFRKCPEKIGDPVMTEPETLMERNDGQLDKAFLLVKIIAALRRRGAVI